MTPLRLALERPMAVIAAVILTLIFGLLALETIPIQLAPDVRRPVITVRTEWPGAAPAEIEREILVPQEEALRGLKGVEEMVSIARDGRGRITLTFAPGTDVDRELSRVGDRLDRVRDLPEDAGKPELSTTGTEDNPIAWFILTRRPGNTRPIHEYGDFVETVIAERLRRVPGVGEVNFFGGARAELQVIVDPRRLAAHGVSVSEVVAALRRADVAATAGEVNEGKRRYVVRVEGGFALPDEVAAVLVRSRRDAASGRVLRVRVGDLAEVRFGHAEPRARIRYLGEPALAINITRDAGANVIETMAAVRAAIAELRRGRLRELGLELRQVYDDTVYINSAISLVVQNIYIGGSLAALVLLLFLRSLAATAVIALSIPVSVVATFVVMAFLGRSLNVVSLAGIAFAVGMVVDAAIVVLENIYRLRGRGMAPFTAALEGTREVWSAILLAALTTVLAFVPLLTLELEVGQLFRDIAVAISVSVIISLLVATTVVPALAHRFLRGDIATLLQRRRLPLVDAAAGFAARLLLGFLRAVVASRLLSLLLVAAVSALALGFAWRHMPKLEYLPEGNRNLVFGVVLPPPGYNLETMLAIGRRIEDAIRPLWAPESDPGADGAARIARFFFVAVPGSAFAGASAVDPERAGELVGPLRRALFAEPGTYGFFSQPSIFGRGLGGARVVRLDVSGPELESVLEVARRASARIAEVFPRRAGHQFRARPGLELGAPELRLLPDRLRLADAGIPAREFAAAVDAFNDGIRVAELVIGGRLVDLVLRGRHGAKRTQEIGDLPILTPSGRVLRAADLSRIVYTTGPVRIRRVEGRRTVSLDLRPAPRVSLEEAIARMRREVVAPLEAEGLPPGIGLRITGTADQLSRTFRALSRDLLLAGVIVFLAMAVLFESFRLALVVLISVPLAAAGGIAGLWILNRFVYQPLDMLTMLGFVILIGVVVNNAILLVERACTHLRAGRGDVVAAIIDAVRERLRPIFMTTATSVFGMLPLVILPGAGSEIYRGLGSVVVGGLSLSALLTLLLVPPLLALTLGRGSRRGAAHQVEPMDLAPAD